MKSPGLCTFPVTENFIVLRLNQDNSDISVTHKILEALVDLFLYLFYGLARRLHLANQGVGRILPSGLITICLVNSGSFQTEIFI